MQRFVDPFVRDAHLVRRWKLVEKAQALNAARIISAERGGDAAFSFVAKVQPERFCAFYVTDDECRAIVRQGIHVFDPNGPDSGASEPLDVPPPTC